MRTTLIYLCLLAVLAAATAQATAPAAAPMVRGGVPSR